MQKLKMAWEKIVYYNQKLIIPSLVILFVIIILEIFFPPTNANVLLAFQITDYFIVTIFVIDLTNLAIKSKNARFFFQNYWMDILAVLPFGLFFRVFGRFFRTISIIEEVNLSQNIIHESLRAERGVKLLAEEGRLVKLLRAVPRSFRFISKSRAFQTFQEKDKQSPFSVLAPKKNTLYNNYTNKNTTTKNLKLKSKKKYAKKSRSNHH